MRVKEGIGLYEGILNGEELVNAAYTGLNGMLDFMKVEKHKGKDAFIIDFNNGNRKKKDYDVFNPVADGIYIPGSTRAYWCGYIDPVDFPLPDYGTIMAENKKTFEFVTIKKIKHLPKGVICQCKNPYSYYKIFDVYTKGWGIYPFCNELYVTIDKMGGVHTTIDRLKLRDDFYANRTRGLAFDQLATLKILPGAISLLADRKYLWNIKTSEPMHFGLNATLNFGVEPDFVKSLVFARDQPLTASGRKRPILHWVRSHKRRIQSGIDIDIKRHLRGITEFEMGDLKFEITEPVKGV